jgi:hypothetical protein
MEEPNVTPEPTEPQGDATPQPQGSEPQAPVKQWYEQVFNDDSLKSDESIKKYKTPDDFAKAFKEKDSMIGRKGVILPNDKDPKDIDRYYNQLGRPESPEKYQAPKIEVEEKFKAFFSDDKLEGFKSIAHKHGLTQKQFEGITKEFTEAQLSEVKNIVHEEQKKFESATQSLMQEWLVDYDANSKQSELAIKSFAEGIDADKISELMKFPDIKKLGFNIAKAISEDKILKGNVNKNEDTVQSLQTFIDSQVKVTGSSYYNQKAPDHLATKQKVNEAYEKLASLRKGAA